MKTSHSIARAVLFACAAAASSYAHAASVGIASGQQTGTNWPMVEDIRAACSTPASPINNVVTNGAMDNIASVYGDAQTQYGIADTATLFYQKGVDPKMMANIVMVFPFFSTDIHLIVPANSPVRSLADLQGRRVIEGPDGSGTWVSTQVIKGLTGLQWNASFEGQAPGLALVQQGRVDAMFVTAGAPIGMLQKAAGVRLVSVSHPALDSFKFFTRASLPASLYPNLGGSSVTTYKIVNGLVTYNYKNQYQAEISQLVTCIARKLPELQAGRSGANGTAHPKWRDVDLTDLERVGWPTHPVALRAIKAVK
jgi:TRAP transporter TAXI family solute receptor